MPSLSTVPEFTPLADPEEYLRVEHQPTTDQPSVDATFDCVEIVKKQSYLNDCTDRGEISHKEKPSKQKKQTQMKMKTVPANIIS